MLSVFWFRRDLRIDDNTALIKALEGPYPVLPIFIFDKNILNELSPDDARVSFIYNSLQKVNKKLVQKGGSLYILTGKPLQVWKQLISNFEVKHVYLNKDYEPYALQRDKELEMFFIKNGIKIYSFKDQVIFEENEVVKDDGTPYTVFTPYKRRWLSRFEKQKLSPSANVNLDNLYKSNFIFPTLDSLGFFQSNIKVKDYDLSRLNIYAETRDFPFQDNTSYLGPHLRFGTVSIREIIRQLKSTDEVFLSELIWREFFMQILYHFPRVVSENFYTKYNDIQWRNNEEEFELWCQGKTGYPLVDAGMRQLNETGYMHNRVRMITASFLCKHLLVDWRWGEAYFAKKLLDYELSSNNGNWQWAAGTGCDSVPYFRVFSPDQQLKKFDKEFKYVKKWITELGTSSYPKPIIDHRYARERSLEIYKKALSLT